MITEWIGFDGTWIKRECIMAIKFIEEKCIVDIVLPWQSHSKMYNSAEEYQNDKHRLMLELGISP